MLDVQPACRARCDTAVQARCLLKCLEPGNANNIAQSSSSCCLLSRATAVTWKDTVGKRWWSLDIPTISFDRTIISCHQFTDCIWGSPPERVNAKSLCFRVLSRFFFSLKLQNWMLSLCSLLSLVSEGRCRPKWEIEGLPIGTSWWWNVKNAEYLIPTFVMCPKPDISMSTKMLFWYRPSRVSGPVQRRGVSEQTGR